MKKGAAIVALLLLVLSLPGPLAAQQARVGVRGFSLVTPLTVAGVSDNNFLVDRSKPDERLFILSLPGTVQALAPSVGPQRLHDQVTIMTLPTLAYQRGGRRYEVTATYMPEFELYRQNSDQNSMNQTAYAEFLIFPSRRTRFSFTDQYWKSKDPVRILQNVSVLLPRSPFRQNAMRGTFEVQATPLTAFEVSYGSAVTTYGQTDPFQARILDNITNGVSFTASRLITRNQRVSGTYSVFKVAPINKAKPNDDAVDTKRENEHPVQTLTMGYQVAFSASTAFAFSGGISTRDNGKSYVFGAMGNRRLGAFWLGAGYSRAVSFALGPGVPTALPSGLAPADTFDQILFRLSGQPTQRVGLQVEANASHNASKRVVGNNFALIGKTRVDYRWTDRTVTFASVETYQAPWNDHIKAPLSRNRFIVGLEFSLSDERERRINRLNRDEDYVALTAHGRRRRTPDPE
ncbi:MAG TPA: hypothetical protein VE422_50850 [Terriglobia bacterium]|nr:hypothetical protein [Terriglobia bacterium]